MPILARLLSLRDTLFRKDRLDRDLDAEIGAAIADLSDRFRSAGLDPVAARREAVHSLGGVANVKESVRDSRIGASLESWLADFRYAARGLRKAPAFTLLIVFTLALGIGANTAMFSVVRTMLIRPLPYRDADRLVFIWLGRNAVGYRGPLAGPDLRDLREGTTTFAGFGGIWASSAISLTGDGEPEQLRAALVTTNFFDILGASPALGRTFRAEDSQPGAEQSILLGWELFQRRFGGDPAIVGQQIEVNEGQARVIGVMPEDFRLLLPADSSVPDRLQAFAPFWPDVENGARGSMFLRVVGRLRSGVTVAAAAEEVSGVARRISSELGRPRVLTAIALQDDDVREIRGPVIALFAGVGILLLIACVNVASLLIARASIRAQEVSLRLALGARHARLVRLFLVEGLLLTLLSSVIGLLVGYVGLRVLLAIVPDSLSRLQPSSLDLTVLAFTLTISIAAAVLFSLAPGDVLRRSNVASALQPELRTTFRSHSHRPRAALVTLQVALSAVLLVAAGLFFRAFLEVVRVYPGFSTSTQLTFRLAVPGRYDSTEKFNTFARELQQRLAALPGVRGVGAMSHLPYDDMPNWALAYGSGPPFPPEAQADARAISPGLFETLDVDLVEGRFFGEGDDNPRNAVAIVDDRLARDLWPGHSAVGQTFATTVAGMNAPIEGPNAKLTVVGVVRHLRLRSLVEDFRPQIFVSWRMAQRNPTAFVIDTVTDPASLTAAIRNTVAELDGRVAVYDVRPMQDYVEQARSIRRFTMLLAALFAGLALTLTLVGVYGVLAYAVAQRRQEIGVRRAVGASAADIVREILREGVGLATLGCAAGLLVAAVGARVLVSQLYGVHPRDPATYVSVFVVIVISAVLACLIPARRATAINPMDALRAG